MGTRLTALLVAFACVAGCVGVACSRASAPAPLLLVFAGQSNMVGLGTRAADLHGQPATPDVSQWDSKSRRWTSLGAVDGQFGPEITAAPAIARALHRRVGVVKVAVSDTNLSYHWNPKRTDGLYVMTTDTVTVATSTPLHGVLPRVAGFFWAQGESDAEDSDSAQRYRERLGELFLAVRRDFFDKRLPIVVVQVRASLPSRMPYAQTVRDAVDSTGRQTPRVRVVNGDDLVLVDGIHYSSDAEMQIGRRMADAYLEVAKTDPALHG